MSAATESFVRSLVADVPELEPILAEHLADFDELLPHVFFGELTRWAEQPSTTHTSLRRLLDRLDTGYADAGVDVRELITVSFLENLAEGSPLGSVLGPTLWAALQSREGGTQ